MWCWASGQQNVSKSIVLLLLVFLCDGICLYVAVQIFNFPLVHHRVEHFQDQLLKCKDTRMGIINEVLNSMRVIKYYAWERKFMHKVNEARRVELGQLKSFAVTNAVLFTIWEVVPALVGVAAFVIYTYYLGELQSLGRFY